MSSLPITRVMLYKHGVGYFDREGRVDGVVNLVLLSILTDTGEIRSFDLHAMASMQILDPTMRRNLDFYLSMKPQHEADD